MINNIGIHCFVSGKVQGVWFRAHTKKEAKRRGLTGWVRNINDGSVEVMAFGPEAEVTSLQAWLHHGPLKAQVDNLSVKLIKWENCSHFVVK